MLLFSLFCAWLAWNVYRPWHGKPEIGGVISFMFGMPVGEMPLHTIAVELIITLLIVAFSGLSGPGDALALAILLGSWLALANFFWMAHRARDEMETGIRECLGDDYEQDLPAETHARLGEPVDYRLLRNPFAFKRPGVQRIRNVPYYTEGDTTLYLDVFHPEALPRNAPVLLQIHGGAWLENVGTKDQQALPLMGRLAEHGWVCVTVQYRLSPSATFPTHIIDCKRALCWVKEHIAEYGGDPDFIVATGGSAGGHLSALLALTANDPEYQPGFETADTAVQGCVPFYGVHDFTNSLGQRRHQGLEKLLADRVLKVSRYENAELWEKASPLLRVTEDAPPMLLVHGNGDTLAPVEESRELAAALRAVPGLQSGFAELSYAQHAFELVWSLRTIHTVVGVEKFGAALHARYLREAAHTDEGQKAAAE